MIPKNPVILILVVVCFLCGWTWNLFKINIFFVPFCLILSYILTDYLLIGKITNLRKVLFICISLFLLGYLFLTSVDKSIFQKSEPETIQIRERYQFFSDELGIGFTGNKPLVLYIDRIRPVLSKFLDNEAKMFDIELYFPSRFSLLLFPLAFIGFLYFIKQANIWVLTFSFAVFLISGFIDNGGIAGPIAFYVLIISFITLGATYFWRFRPK